MPRPYARRILSRPPFNRTHDNDEERGRLDKQEIDNFVSNAASETTVQGVAEAWSRHRGVALGGGRLKLSWKSL